MMLKAGLLACLLAASSPALALDVPTPSSSDSRVRSVSYNEWDVVRVVGTIRTSVQIVFAQGEEVTDVAGGDTVSWEVVPRANILYLKPREKNPPTNLQVATTRSDGTTRTYSFELIVRDGEITANSKDVYFQVRFSYPRDEVLARREAAAEARSKARDEAAKARLAQTVATAGEKNWMFLAAGAADLQPTEAFDNGEQTVLTFARRTRLPSVYLVDRGGEERLANTTVRRNQIIVHDVAPEIRLRLGKQVTAIYNVGPAYDRGGDTGTGTSSRTVNREIIGG
ncbi:P-type conjugative transfer protein VirB9 [Cereibacter sphaeroides]|uniref:P-type conjugative transfer protein VirB9 n=1 Tax=Cereibacter sphaeroides TaxID=1063 RepID=UPI001F312148|nr:P-type conjugative transfer protein VirB9 [Cereibacter sphaeroides]MCE6967525.1 P-type conjugative transfer protein VirB9 [Cereibacter sphaeroides]